MYSLSNFAHTCLPPWVWPFSSFLEKHGVVVWDIGQEDGHFLVGTWHVHGWWFGGMLGLFWWTARTEQTWATLIVAFQAWTLHRLFFCGSFVASVRVTPRFYLLISLSPSHLLPSLLSLLCCAFYPVLLAACPFVVVLPCRRLPTC